MTLHNDRMYKNSLYIVLTALIVTSLLLTGCKKESTKPIVSTSPKAGIKLIHGSGQSGVYGQDLTDSLVVQILPPAGKNITQYAVSFNMLQGNGLVEGFNPGSYINTTLGSDGKIQVKWRLGCDNPTQKLTVYLYADSLISYGNTPKGPPDDSLVVSASGSKPGGWGRACGCGSALTYTTKIATFDNHTLYMANNGLFSSTDGGINWYKVNGVPNWQSIMDVQFNSKGWMYVLTANNGVYYSQDAKSWTPINNGILDLRTPTAFTVTDDLLFVSFYFDGPYITSNNGGFWQKVLAGFNSQRFYLIRHRPNGPIYLFNDWNDLLTSNDGGTTWQKMPVSSPMVNYAAYDLEIGPDGLLYIGSDDATIATFSPMTMQGTYKSFYQYNSSNQPTNNINFYNGDVYFLLNSNPQPGIYSMKNLE
ncbi:MAG: hypothetical protein ABI113_17145 [Mucilaginibacter sp.]